MNKEQREQLASDLMAEAEHRRGRIVDLLRNAAAVLSTLPQEQTHEGRPAAMNFASVIQHGQEAIRATMEAASAPPSNGDGLCNSDSPASRCERHEELGHRVRVATSVAVPAELTNVRCMCGDEYPHDSYGAGFIAGSGMCENCDAAIPAKEPPAAGVPEGWRELAQEAAGALQVFTGHDSGPNLRRRYGEHWWEPLNQLRAKLRAELAATPTPPASEQLTDAARDVLAERRRQVQDEQWTPAHDDRYRQRQLAMAAACYAAAVPVHDVLDYSDGQIEKRVPAMPSAWPWAASWWKPGTARKNLVRAGALILAEIERLDRKQQASPREGEQ